MNNLSIAVEKDGDGKFSAPLKGDEIRKRLTLVPLTLAFP